MVKRSKYTKYAPLLKDSIAYMETPDWRIFLMKDLAAVDEAVRMGVEMYQGDYGGLWVVGVMLPFLPVNILKSNLQIVLGFCTQLIGD